MKKFIEKYLAPIQIIVFVLLFGFAGTAGYFIYSISKDISAMKIELASSTKDLASKIDGLQLGLAATINTTGQLTQGLQYQQNQSSIIGQTLSGLTGTVNTLEKLSKTDRELLQKYSKVYFLNENYVPVQLSNIDQKYLKNKNDNLQFHTVVLPFLNKMIDDADLGTTTNLQVVSAYRSFGEQGALKSAYKVIYGSGANTFSADQGYSEHQLGTTVDLSSPTSDAVLEIKFENSPAFAWLKDNAYKYGFVLSYPKGNAYYQYEPWHWRFVGIALATELHNEGKNFYDLPQRDIDAYLTIIFDQSPQ